MAWATTTDVDRFVATAWPFLCARPVEHSALLTETDYLRGRPLPGQRFGWWVDDRGAVDGAFVRAPRHPPIVSELPVAAIKQLPTALPDLDGVGVPGSAATAVVEAFARHGLVLRPAHRISVLCLTELGSPPSPPGRPRPARPADRALIVDWFRRLMAANPDDPSDLEYVVDVPLADGGITLWEVDEVPVAMAGRSRILAGMTRLGAAFAPGGESGYERAAVVAATTTAAANARHVLLFLAAEDPSAAGWQELGFEPVHERVLLARTAESAVSPG